MASIGAFRKTGDEYFGEISTLSLQAKNVRIAPDEFPTSDKAPTHRVTVGGVEIGAAWTKRSKKTGGSYLSVKLDDPGFRVPIFANLWADEDGESYTLLWSRARRANGD